MAFKMTPGRGSFAKTGRSIPTPFKQVDKEVDAIVKKQKDQLAAAKLQKLRSEAEAARNTQEKNQRFKLKNENEAKAKSDSTAVDKRLRDVGLPYTAGKMGHAKAEETRNSIDRNGNPKTNQKKTPAQMKKSPVKQTMGAVGAGAGTATGKYITKKVNQAGSAISSAHKAGKKAFKEGESADSFATGSGAMRSYKRDGLDYVKGFASDLVSGNNAKTNQKKKSPVKQMETIKKVYNKGKELVSKAGDKISKANDAGQESYDKSIKGDTFWGGSGAKRSYTKNPVEYVKGFVKNITSDDNPKTKEKKKSPAKQCFPTPQEKADSAKKNFENRKNGPSTPMAKGPSKDAMKKRGIKYEPSNPSNKEMQRVYKGSPAKQLGRQAVTKMGGKKTPVKMKSC